MEDIYRYEFTLEEVSDLVMGIVTAKVEDELFLKEFPDDTELNEKIKDNVRRYNALLDKIRRDVK